MSQSENLEHIEIVVDTGASGSEHRYYRVLETVAEITLDNSNNDVQPESVFLNDNDVFGKLLNLIN